MYSVSRSVSPLCKANVMWCYLANMVHQVSGWNLRNDIKASGIWGVFSSSSTDPF